MINPVNSPTFSPIINPINPSDVKKETSPTSLPNPSPTTPTTQPNLPLGEPAAMVAFLKGYSAMPSLGSTMLALIQECSSEQRRAAADQRAIQTELTVDTIEEQAGEMRSKAITALVTGVVSGALSIAGGIASVGMASATLGKIKTDQLLPRADRMSDAQIMAKNSLTQGVGSLFSSSSQLVGTIGQGVTGFMEADIKQMDAQIERIRATTDTLKMLEDGLKELIQKTQSSMDAIQANMNQTRTKILG
ncbi:MAG: type III secretion system translocon subunit SctB [Desulfovibrionaceae bacterium]|nr:type III secretion system translocon subunit SctB [Desulfovibrionaceae bacterium]